MEQTFPSFVRQYKITFRIYPNVIGRWIWNMAKQWMPSIVTYVCMPGEHIFRIFFFRYPLLHGWNIADTAYNSIQSINQSINHSLGVTFIYKTLSIYSGMTLQYLHYVFLPWVQTLFDNFSFVLILRKPMCFSIFLLFFSFNLIVISSLHFIINYTNINTFLY